MVFHPDNRSCRLFTDVWVGNAWAVFTNPEAEKEKNDEHALYP